MRVKIHDSWWYRRNNIIIRIRQFNFVIFFPAFQHVAAIPGTRREIYKDARFVIQSSKYGHAVVCALKYFTLEIITPAAVPRQPSVRENNTTCLVITTTTRLRFIIIYLSKSPYGVRATANAINSLHTCNRRIADLLLLRRRRRPGHIIIFI